MVTNEELMEAAEILKEYCDKRGDCTECPFDRGITCGINSPDEWSL